MTHPLDNPVHVALLDGQRAFGERNGEAMRFQPAVAPFVGVPSGSEADVWAQLAELLGRGGLGAVVGDDSTLPDGWTVVRVLSGVQMVAAAAQGARDEALLTLGEPDVDEMLALTAATQPGPFFPRTHELGHYVGVRDEQTGALVAMAGERMRPTGWTEISAVCTAATHRGRGLAARLVNHLLAEIVGRDEIPILHAVSENVAAIRLYESLGFAIRRSIDFTLVTAPGGTETSADPGTAP